jgi:tRNA dimethylallyltransferase
MGPAEQPGRAAGGPPLLAIVGVTAVGKTALALDLAERVGGEIVGADSRQVYRTMNIGTAKPTPAELARVPHHLIDIIPPDGEFSLAIYLELARRAIDAIHARGRLPLLVGGTGQYLAALLEGWRLPDVAPQPALRARLEDEARARGAGALYERLIALDPAASGFVEPHNLRRIVRALEVIEVSGQPFSRQRERVPPPYATRTLWLTLPRPQAYARIDARVDAMIAAGLLDEVRGLLARGYGYSLPAMSSLGYIQFQPFFAGEASLEDCVARLKFDTHSFARQQEQWFRRLPNLSSLAADAADLRAAVLELAR